MTLNIQHLTKTYRDKAALKDITLTIEPNTIYGLLGRNGAGKSTLLNIINNRSLPTEGMIELNQHSVIDNEKALRHLYLMSEDNLYPSTMKIKEMFKISEAFYGSFDWELAEKMRADFDLPIKKQVRKLSTGYRSIAKLIVALCVPCDYIFLDEPVLGLDANHREMFYSFLLESYEERPRTFVISTHLIEEISNLLEEVIIVDRGRITQQASVEAILTSAKIISGPKEELLPFMDDLPVIGKEELGNLLTLYTQGTFTTNLPDTVTVKPLPLQQYFIQLTQKGRR